jgi:hypothetical protein
MAHYAFLNEDNIVTEVIVGVDETELIEGLSPEKWYANFRGQECVRTSYNGKIRFNYAGIGYFYNPVVDAFIAPEPKCGHKELTLNTNTYKWECNNKEHELKIEA